MQNLAFLKLKLIFLTFNSNPLTLKALFKVGFVSQNKIFQYKPNTRKLKKKLIRF